MFERLLNASDSLLPSVSKLLHKAGLPVGKWLIRISMGRSMSVRLEEKELLRLTNPDNIRVEASYRGPRKMLLFVTRVRSPAFVLRYRWTDYSESIRRFNRSIPTWPSKSSDEGWYRKLCKAFRWRCSPLSSSLVQVTIDWWMFSRSSTRNTCVKFFIKDEPYWRLYRISITSIWPIYGMYSSSVIFMDNWLICCISSAR